MNNKALISTLTKLLRRLLKSSEDSEEDILKMFRFDRISARKWKYIIIHHSATEDGDTYNWDEISRYHVKIRKWKGIGYHFGVEKIRGEYVICIGRGLDQIGAHTRGMNEMGIGVCLIGNYDKVEPNATQYWYLACLCRNLMRTFDIPIGHIQAHRNYADKTCPGKKFSMSRLIFAIRGGRHEHS